MFSFSETRSRSPGSNPDLGYCVVMLGRDFLLSKCLTPHRCIHGYKAASSFRGTGGGGGEANPAVDKQFIQRGVDIFLAKS